MRALKRRLSDVVNKQMAADAKRLETVPGGHTAEKTSLKIESPLRDHVRPSAHAPCRKWKLDFASGIGLVTVPG